MVVRWIKDTCAGATVCGMLLLASQAHGQLFPGRQAPAPCCNPPPCASLPPLPVSPGPGDTSSGNQPPIVPPNIAEQSLGSEQSAATTPGNLALAAPNMMGHLLGAGRSVSFFYQRTQGSVFINGTGSTNIINPSVADNNSPLPEDRVAFRYNYFNDAQKVVGDSGKVIFDPSLGVSSTSAPRFRGIPQTKSYDVNDFVFSGEKTFFDGLASVEVRIPFTHALSHNQNLSVAKVSGIGRDNDGDSNEAVIATTPTPGNTLGQADTELGNSTVILKALAYRSQHWAFSGGLSIGIPTGPDTRTKVTDFLGDAVDNDIEVERLRQFEISNDTWAASPFLAFLATPNDRFFVQGFTQLDIPLNKSSIHYTEAALLNTEPNELHFDPIFADTSIREQTLLQLDLGTGYWLLKNPAKQWITGIASTLEVHYTSTLNNADVRTLPVADKGASLSVVGPNGLPIPEPNPTVGNLRNRLNIVDMTVGATFLIGDRATVATGVAFPLTTGNNRTFSWEYQLQVNFYFGPSTTRSTGWAPNF